MRSLKFRAWDKEEKEYYYNAEYTYDFYCSGRGCYAESFGEVLNQPERFIVEQYTGLKDKNGKMIWEGDIIKYKLYEDSKLDYIDEVFYSTISGAFVVGDGVNIRTLDCLVNIEVIGNTHENPELLGGEE